MIVLIVVFVGLSVNIMSSSAGTVLRKECRFSDLPGEVHDKNTAAHSPKAPSGTILAFECEEKYKKQSTNVSCIDGKWSEPMPPCQLVKCPVPHHPIGGLMVMASRGYSSTVTYTCDDGFWYNGSLPRICQRNGSWSGEVGNCKAVLCNILRDPPHGKILQPERTFQAVATVQCDEGFIYSKPDSLTRTCLSDNKWSVQEEGRCEGVICPESYDLRNGLIQYSSRTYMAEASVLCNEGYIYSKPEAHVIKCQGDNTWSAAEGTCEAVECPDLMEVTHGEITLKVGRFGDESILQCDTGFTLDGPGKVKCQTNGNWSVPFGICITPKEEGATTTTSIAIAVVTLVITIGIAAGIISWFTYRHYHTNSRFPILRESSSEHETVPLMRIDGPEEIQKKRHYLSFTLETKSKFEDQSADELSSHNPAEALKSTVVENIEKDLLLNLDVPVHEEGSFFCEHNMAFFMDLVFDKGVSQGDIIDILKKCEVEVKISSYRIVAESIHFRERPVHLIVAAIHQMQHTPDKKIDQKINLDSQYVRLKLLSCQKVDIMNRDTLERPDRYEKHLKHTTGTDIQDEDLVKPSDFRNYILLRGRAGIGKTTLLQRIIWKWANGEWASKFQVMFLLNLRSLMNLPKPMSLAYLLSLHTVYNTGNPNVIIDNKWLQENQGRIAIAFDGIDEIANFKKRWQAAKAEHDGKALDWCFALMKRYCLRNSTIIISSRPFGDLTEIERFMENEDLSLHFSVIELMGLTGERLMEFVDKNCTPERKSFVEETLNKNPLLKSVCTITFYCASLCLLLAEHSVQIPQLKTYTRITAYIMEMYMQRYSQSKEDISPSEMYSEMGPALQFLSRLAADGLVDHSQNGLSRLIFDQKDVDALAENNGNPHHRSNAGLLMETEIRNAEHPEETQVQSQFVHLSIQEFLAMGGLIEDRPERVKDTVLRFAQSGQFNMALLFLYGLMFDRTDETIQNITNALATGARTRGEAEKLLLDATLDIKSDLQAFQIAHESQSESVAKNVASKMVQNGQLNLDGIKLTAIDVMSIAFTLKHQPSVRAISLTDAGLDLISIRLVGEFLRDTRHIEALELADGNVNDEGAAALMDGVRQSKGLQKFELYTTSLTDTGINDVASGIEQLETLKFLRLTCCQVTGEGLKRITKAAMGHKALEELHWTTDDLTDDSVKQVAVLLKQKTIKKLSLYSEGVTDTAVEYISKALAVGTSLKELRLQSSRITDKGVMCLSEALRKDKTLQYVWFRGLVMGEGGLQAIIDALEKNMDLHVRISGLSSHLRGKTKGIARISVD